MVKNVKLVWSHVTFYACDTDKCTRIAFAHALKQILKQSGGRILRDKASFTRRHASMRDDINMNLLSMVGAMLVIYCFKRLPPACDCVGNAMVRNTSRQVLNHKSYLNGPLVVCIAGVNRRLFWLDGSLNCVLHWRRRHTLCIPQQPFQWWCMAACHYHQHVLPIQVIHF